MKAGTQCIARMARRRSNPQCVVRTKHPSRMCAYHREICVRREERHVAEMAEKLVIYGLDFVAPLARAVSALRRTKGLLPCPGRHACGRDDHAHDEAARRFERELREGKP